MPKKKKVEPEAPQVLNREQVSSYKPTESAFDSMKIVTDPTLNSLFELAKNTNSYVVPSSIPIKNNVVPKLSK